MQDKIFSLLVEQNEISWKSIILDLIRTEKMDPWNIDLSLLAKRYIEHINGLKQRDLNLSGKVLLAAAILLRIKSSRLVGEDLDEFDRLMAGTELSSEQFYDELEQELRKGEEIGNKEDYELMPRLPQARRRKVSVYELVKALEKALEVKQRRTLQSMPTIMELPARNFDVTAAITGLYQRITSLFRAKGKLSFSELLTRGTKEEKVYTFIPLLHLSNQQKIELKQEKAFGEITISLQGARNAD